MKDKKERDRDRNRDRDRDRDKERDRDRNRDRDRGERERDRNREKGEREREREKEKETDKDPKKDKNNEEKQDGQEQTSLSIEDSNKLRISLGLKPLKIESAEEKIAKETKSREEREQASKLARAAELQDHLEKTRNQRLLHANLPGKSIAEQVEDDEDTFSWVNKLRQKAKEDEEAKKQKEEAVQRSKMFDEQDQEFEASSNLNNYSSKDLSGLKVGHSLQDISEEQEIILTLKDKRIIKGDDLEEDPEELENLHLLEAEKLKKNSELKRKKSRYEDVMDEKSTLLSKYDDEPEKESFTLTVKEEEDEVQKKQRQLEAIRRRLKKTSEPAEEKANKLVYDLNNTEVRVASDYLTPAETAEFHKPKEKKKKLRKKKADEVLPFLPDDEDDKGDHGSRLQSVKLKREEKQREEESKKRARGYASALERANFESQMLRGTSMDLETDLLESKGNFHQTKKPKRSYREDNAAPEEKAEEDAEEEEDESFVPDDDDELYSKLAKARRQQQLKMLQEQELADKVKRKKDPEVEVKTDQQTVDELVITSTDEFCRHLQVLPQSKGRSFLVKEDKVSDEEQQQNKNKGTDVKMEEASQTQDQEEKMQSSEMGDGDDNDNENDDDDDQKGLEDIIPDEPLVMNGLASTLALLKQRGEHDTTEVLPAGRITDKFLDPNKDQDKIRLEYLDERGRVMTPKEAFRFLSHRFHGKKPGKNKQEKKLRREQEEMKRLNMSSTDTPLHSVEALVSTQEKTKMPYVVLSKTKTNQQSLLEMKKVELDKERKK